MLDLRRVDLHTHTWHSDGVLSPGDLVRKVREHNIHVLSVTDHDTVSGIPEAFESGKRYGVEIITGVELSITVSGQELHLLGYFFDHENEGIRQHLAYFHEERRKRVVRMIERLNEIGIPLDVDEVLSRANGATLGRPHVAAALFEGGFVESYQDAFTEYLRDEGAAFVAKPLFEAPEALNMLHEAGGISVLAHPGHWTSDAALMSLIRAGLDGIEVIHPSHDAMLTRYYRQIAREFGLIETGGSDYHGYRTEDEQRLGQYSLPYPNMKRICQAVKRTMN